MELSDYIAHLLQNHDCVIVPDFGGFIANYKPAVIDQAKNRILPPSKDVLFNPNLVNNDGLLGNEIAEKEQIAYPDALSFISEKVHLWRKELAKGSRIEVGEIGFLFQQNDQIIFEQSREVNLLLNAYGLSSISFVNFTKAEVKEESPKIEQPVVERKTETKVIALTPSEPIVSITEEQEETVVPITRKRRNGWKYLAAAAAIPLLFYAYWIPVETDFIDTGKIQIADFNPINSSPERTYRVRENNFETTEATAFESWEDLTAGLGENNVAVYNYRFNDELYIPVRLDKTATELPEEEADVNAPELMAETDLIYHVIGGCFSVKSNADNFVTDLISDGYSNAHVLDFNNGLYRVTAGDYADRSTAKEKLKLFKNSGFSGWILKK